MNFFGREKTKDAHKHIQKGFQAVLLAAVFPAVVSAAPVLITVDWNRSAAPAPTVLNEKDSVNSADSGLAEALASIGNGSAKPTTFNLAIPSNPQQTAHISLPHWSDRVDAFFAGRSSSRWGHPLFWIKLPNNPQTDFHGGPPPAVIVPAPGSILLGSVGLLLVRALRLRRIIA